MIVSLLFQLLALGLLLLVIMAALAPFEAMSWWAGWSDRAQKLDALASASHNATAAQAPAQADQYAVFLSGIGTMGGDSLSDDERAFLDRLDAQVPGTVIVDDVFPYSVDNNALTGQRAFAGFWRKLQYFRVTGQRPLLVFLINVRNLFQVAVSSDRRYGPIYNRGSAEVILKGLLRQGYQIGSGKPVILLGSSGGGQISLGAATYLKQALQAPLWLVSIGGVMCSDPGTHYIEHLYHLHGEKDSVDRLGAIVFPGRWRVLQHSDWNWAISRGKISVLTVGPMGHNGPGSYLCQQSHLADGQSYLDKTAAVVAALITGIASGQPPAIPEHVRVSLPSAA